MHSVSVNIQRDFDKDFDYIVTPNSISITNSIYESYISGTRSFFVQGSYGTGKSSYIWALQQQLRGKQQYFNLNITGDSNDLEWECLNLVGKPMSLIAHFGEALLEDADSSADDVIQNIQTRISNCNAQGVGFFLVLDEFGKHIEYIIRNQLLDEFYFLQQVAEIFNSSDSEAFFLLTLHQDLLSYIPNAEVQTKNEWLKVSGRFKSLLFNEPIEQLIYFAQRSLSEIKVDKDYQKRHERLNDLIRESGLVEVQNLDDYNSLSSELFPLDWLSAHILVSALQKYGQNERSLFLFLDTEKRYKRLRPVEFYSVSRVFDYLVENMSPVIQSPDNPHRLQWHAINKALDRADALVGRNSQQNSDLVKIVGLVNLFCKPSGCLDATFLKKYIELTIGLNVTSNVRKLEENKIIRFFQYRNKFNFLDGTDIDIDYELNVVHKEVSSSFSMLEQLPKLLSFPTKLAKRISYQKGVQRYFSIELLQKDSDFDTLDNAHDGKIFLSFSSLFSTAELKKISSKIKYPAIFVNYINSDQINSLLLDIKKYELVQSRYKGDFAAVKIINEELSFLKIKVNELVFTRMYSVKDGRKKSNIWITNGKDIIVENSRKLNEVLSKQIDQFYPLTPKYKNELINRDILSTPINTARKNLFKLLLGDSVKNGDLGFKSDKFPPEKTIYLSLIKRHNMHVKLGDGTYKLTEPNEDSGLFKLWQETEKILKKSAHVKMPIMRFSEELSSHESKFKLKSGFLQFWVSLFLIIKKEEYSLYRGQDTFVPYLSEDVYDVLHKNPHLFYVKFYESSDDKKELTELYRMLWGEQENLQSGGKSFLKLYANFLKIIRTQPAYSRKTQNLSPIAIGLRDSILNAKSPEEALFDSIPRVLGIKMGKDGFSNEKDMELFVEQLRGVLIEIQSAFSELLGKMELLILSCFNIEKGIEFPDYKMHIHHKIQDVKKELLNPKLNVFYNRLVSPLEDRNSWLISVLDAAHGSGRSFKDVEDNEIAVIENNLKGYINSLFNHIDIITASSGVKGYTDYLQLDFTTVDGSSYKRVVDLKQKPDKEILKLKDNIGSLEESEFNWLIAKYYESKLKS